MDHYFNYLWFIVHTTSCKFIAELPNGQADAIYSCPVLAFDVDSRDPKRDRRTALMLFESIKKDGYTGGYSILTDYVRNWRNGLIPGLGLTNQFQIFLVQTFLVLNMLGIFIDTIDRANFYALRQIMMPYTLGTQLRINDINVLTLGNRAIRAFRFANITVDAFIVNNKGHIDS
jgi:hypothetical protein